MGELTWFPPDVTPTDETPVVAEYREWGMPYGKKRTHTVWWFNGGWRCYPETGGYAYVDRWRYKKSRARSGEHQSPTGESDAS